MDNLELDDCLYTLDVNRLTKIWGNIHILSTFIDNIDTLIGNGDELHNLYNKDLMDSLVDVLSEYNIKLSIGEIKRKIDISIDVLMCYFTYDTFTFMSTYSTLDDTTIVILVSG